VIATPPPPPPPPSAAPPPLPGDSLSKFRHDLSNPLSAILAETQLLLLSQDKYDEETLTSLKQIEAMARRMRQMLQTLE
jgi:signal transduction histidine kinase